MLSKWICLIIYINFFQFKNCQLVFEEDEDLEDNLESDRRSRSNYFHTASNMDVEPHYDSESRTSTLQSILFKQNKRYRAATSPTKPSRIVVAQGKDEGGHYEGDGVPSTSFKSLSEKPQYRNMKFVKDMFRHYANDELSKPFRQPKHRTRSGRLVYGDKLNPDSPKTSLSYEEENSRSSEFFEQNAKYSNAVEKHIPWLKKLAQKQKDRRANAFRNAKKPHHHKPNRNRKPDKEVIWHNYDEAEDEREYLDELNSLRFNPSPAPTVSTTTTVRPVVAITTTTGKPTTFSEPVDLNDPTQNPWIPITSINHLVTPPSDFLKLDDDGYPDLKLYEEGDSSEEYDTGLLGAEPLPVPSAIVSQVGENNATQHQDAAIKNHQSTYSSERPNHGITYFYPKPKRQTNIFQAIVNRFIPRRPNVNFSPLLQAHNLFFKQRALNGTSGTHYYQDSGDDDEYQFDDYDSSYASDTVNQFYAQPDGVRQVTNTGAYVASPEKIAENQLFSAEHRGVNDLNSQYYYDQKNNLNHPTLGQGQSFGSSKGSYMYSSMSFPNAATTSSGSNTFIRNEFAPGNQQKRQAYPTVVVANARQPPAGIFGRLANGQEHRKSGATGGNLEAQQPITVPIVANFGGGGGIVKSIPTAIFIRDSSRPPVALYPASVDPSNPTAPIGVEESNFVTQSPSSAIIPKSAGTTPVAPFSGFAVSESENPLFIQYPHVNGDAPPVPDFATPDDQLQFVDPLPQRPLSNLPPYPFYEEDPGLYELTAPPRPQRQVVAGSDVRQPVGQSAANSASASLKTNPLLRPGIRLAQSLAPVRQFLSNVKPAQNLRLLSYKVFNPFKTPPSVSPSPVPAIARRKRKPLMTFDPFQNPFRHLKYAIQRNRKLSANKAS